MAMKLPRRLLATRLSTMPSQKQDSEAWGLRQYALVGIGGVLLTYGAVTTAIVTYPEIRYPVEERLPAYVQFVREFHEFQDEDLVERERLLATAEMLKKEVRAIGLTADGQRISMEVISGSTPYSQLRAEVEQKAGGVPIIDIQFADSSESGNSDAEEDETENTRPTLLRNNVALAQQFEKKKDGFTPNTLSTVKYERSEWDETDYGGILREAEAVVASPRMKEGGTRSGGDRGNWRDKELSRGQMIGEQFDNYVGKFVLTLRQYFGVKQSASLTNKNDFMLKDVDKNNMFEELLPRNSTLGMSREKAEALQAIVELRRQLEVLELEKTFGKREIDSIEEDSRRIKSKITELQRKHINYFYYF